MTELTKTQALVLSRAAQNADGIALPLPSHLHGAVAKKVVGMLIERGLLAEVDASLRRGDPLWRETGGGHGTTLVITGAGLAAIGAEPKPTGASDDNVAVNNAGPSKPKASRRPTKQDMLIDMLRCPKGASLEEITTALGWQRHTARGAISNLRKRYPDISVVSTKADGQVRVYSIAD